MPSIKIIGQAVLKDGELRCIAPRKEDKTRQCHKLICLVNRNAMLLGKFLCSRCKSKVELI